MSNTMDMSKRLALAAACALGMAAAGTVSAEPSNPLTQTTPTESTPPEMSTGPSEDYTKLDTDKDGAISRAEARKNRELMKKWTSLDANKDGKLDQGEFAQFEVAPPSSPVEPKAKETPAAPPTM